MLVECPCLVVEQTTAIKPSTYAHERSGSLLPSVCYRTTTHHSSTTPSQVVCFSSNWVKQPRPPPPPPPVCQHTPSLHTTTPLWSGFSSKQVLLNCNRCQGENQFPVEAQHNDSVGVLWERIGDGGCCYSDIRTVVAVLLLLLLFLRCCFSRWCCYCCCQIRVDNVPKPVVVEF